MKKVVTFAVYPGNPRHLGLKIEPKEKGDYEKFMASAEQIKSNLVKFSGSLGKGMSSIHSNISKGQLTDPNATVPYVEIQLPFKVETLLNLASVIKVIVQKEGVNLNECRRALQHAKPIFSDDADEIESLLDELIGYIK